MTTNWTAILIITHSMSFVLITLVMVGLEQRRSYYEGQGCSVNLMQAGFISLMLGMAVEFAWHHFVQGWHYSNDFHWLNGSMYFFLALGFTLLAMGFRRERWGDALLAATVVLTPLAYLAGMKPVIWNALLVALIILTYRSYLVLKTKQVLWFPFFSFIMNMAFAMRLFITGDPIYHVLHDVLGTLLGLAILGYLIWRCPTRQAQETGDRPGLTCSQHEDGSRFDETSLGDNGLEPVLDSR